MWLRGLTTFFLALGVFLALGFPWLVGGRPTETAALERYVVRFGVYLIVALLSFLGAAACALMMIRKAREKYRAESRENLEHLIESTLMSHKSRGSEPHD